MSLNKSLRVLLVGPNASENMGGEAILPLHWLRELRQRGVDAEILTHARCREELMASRYADMPIRFVEDAPLEKGIYRLIKDKPTAIRELGLQVLAMITNLRLGAAVKAAHKSQPYDLIHQVIPVAPKALVFSKLDGVPLICGPMNGNMSYPDGFEASHGAGTGKLKRLLTGLTTLGHFVFPSKRNSSRLIVANRRTASGLPDNAPQDRVVELVENGVDLDRWVMPKATTPAEPTFVFVGRLVHWKAVDILLRAFDRLPPQTHLQIIGQGADREKLEALAASLPSAARISFLGQMPQSEVREHMAAATALVLPSVWECGGAVVLEAMACAKPVIATAWGGPCDYITEDTGILVPPLSHDALIQGLSEAMTTIAADPAKAEAMGQAGRARVETTFSWSAKADEMMTIYRDVLAEHPATGSVRAS
ncbi:glycosyltransferase family 4 protein [Parvularcula sp. LCG005]|uniref:glycosyltransferase family 4 protein n=1 Tax=Parvularcula sp. LCG005 TaxID=3078805 RepID=UPI002941E9AE|nr:glycosyltransferase family 4 protein [Parvularcula sp. LCG005]WOI53291.1 glycosyltransferase family 4 protein [Parvularcula sp. LCG005]